MKFNNLIEKIKDGNFETSDIVVRSYVPLAEKFASIRRIGKEINLNIDDFINNENFGYDYIYLKYELEKYFTLIEKYTNLIIKKDEKTLENYDILMSSGVFDYINKICEKDYNDFSNLCDRVVGIDNLSITRQLSNLLTTEVVSKNLKNIKRSIDGISKEKLNILKDIHEYNNPLYKELYDNAIKSSINESKNKQKELRVVNSLSGD